jgi:hypothetical protein
MPCRLTSRYATAVIGLTLLYVLGLLILAVYLNAGPVNGSRLTIGLVGLAVACVGALALRWAWQRLDTLD